MKWTKPPRSNSFGCDVRAAEWVKPWEFSCYALVSFVAAALLTGCGTSQPPVALPRAASQAKANAVLARAGEAGPFLYVGGFSVSMYALGSSRPLHSRTVNDYVVKAELALDLHGDLCESNGDISAAQILAFNAHNLKLLGVVNGAGAYPALVADRLGYLYASTGGAAIYVYAPGCTHVEDVIYRGADSVGPLAFDHSGNLYAGVQPHYAVSVYAPTKRPGHMKFVRRIRDGINNPTALAVGPSDELFVGNWSDSGGYVTVYRLGGSTPLRRITKGMKVPMALAVDSKGRLYVAVPNYEVRSGWISVYAPGGSHPVRKIRVRDPVALALDPSDNLYVADYYRSVLVYNPGATKLLRRITDGAHGASGLLIGRP